MTSSKYKRDGNFIWILVGVFRTYLVFIRFAKSALNALGKYFQILLCLNKCSLCSRYSKIILEIIVVFLGFCLVSFWPRKVFYKKNRAHTPMDRNHFGPGTQRMAQPAAGQLRPKASARRPPHARPPSPSPCSHAAPAARWGPPPGCPNLPLASLR
mgnify:CR=1 FL=1